MKLCGFETCDRQAAAKGLCLQHRRQQRNGRELTQIKRMAKKSDSVDVRMARFTNRTETCWQWVGYVDRDGYGAITLEAVKRKAHRVAYKMAKGEIPDGFDIDHLCRNTACVNPDHLEAVPPEENQRRRISALGVRKRSRALVARTCSVADCEATGAARGLCTRHYRELRIREGRIPVCSISGCHNYSLARGWCGSHYVKARHG